MCSTVPRRPTTTADPVTCSAPAAGRTDGQGVEGHRDPLARPRLALVAGHVRVEGGATSAANDAGPVSASDRSPGTVRHDA